MCRFLTVALCVTKAFSQVHLVEEFKSIKVELSPAFAYLVDIKLVYHILDREHFAAHKDSSRLGYHVNVFTVRRVPTEQRYRVEKRLRQEALIFV